MRVQLRGYWTERRKDGTTRHRVMSVMSHVSPTTSAERTRLAGEALAAIGGLRFD